MKFALFFIVSLWGFYFKGKGFWEKFSDILIFDLEEFAIWTSAQQLEINLER